MIPIWVLLLLHFQSPSNTITDLQPPWQTLTPSTDLSGWKVCCGPAKYTVSNGVVTGTTVPGSPNTFLITEQEWGDFELEYEFKVDSRLNAGVQVRSEVDSGVMRGCQIEIDMDEDRQRFWSAGIFEEGGRGWLCDLSKNEPAIAAHKLGDWNQVRVVAKGALIESSLNGIPAARTWCGNRISGVIGLQVHGVSAQQKDPLQVKWRNIRIRDLGTHHWVPFQKFTEQANPAKKNHDSGPSLLLPENVNTLRLKIEAPLSRELEFRLGALRFEVLPKSHYSYQFPPSTEEDDLMESFGGGAFGSSGEKSSSWAGSTVYLHNGAWGSGFEIIPAQGPQQPRKMALSTTPGSTSPRILAISSSPPNPWQLEVLVPKIPTKTPQEGK